MSLQSYGFYALGPSVLTAAGVAEGDPAISTSIDPARLIRNGVPVPGTPKYRSLLFTILGDTENTAFTAVVYAIPKAHDNNRSGVLLRLATFTGTIGQNGNFPGTPQGAFCAKTLVLSSEGGFSTLIKNVSGANAPSAYSPGTTSGVAVACVPDIGNCDIYIDLFSASGASLTPVYQLLV
jgi:hypothetical protein